MGAPFIRKGKDIKIVTVLIPFEKDPINFAVLLSSLQPQLHPDDDIYIIDSSEEKLALKIATIYGTTRCYIFVELAPHDKCLEYGIQSMVENNQEALIFLNEDCFISSTFIANMKKAIKEGYEITSPTVFRNPYHKMDNNFKFYNPTDGKIKKAKEFNADCFLINNKTKKKGYGYLDSEYVLVLKNTE